VFTTSTVGTEDVVGEALAGVGKEETIESVVVGSATVGASVGAGLRHLSVLIP